MYQLTSKDLWRERRTRIPVGERLKMREYTSKFLYNKFGVIYDYEIFPLCENEDE